MLKVIALVCVFLLLNFASSEGEDAPLTPPEETSSYDSYRLPTSITPENYKLEVITHMNDTEGFVFRGSVWITVRIENWVHFDIAQESSWRKGAVINSDFAPISNLFTFDLCRWKQRKCVDIQHWFMNRQLSCCMPLELDKKLRNLNLICIFKL